MSQEDARTRIRDYLRQSLGDPDLADDCDIFASGLVKSIFALELVDFIGQELGATVDSDDLEISNFSSVDALVRLVARKSAAGP